MEQHHNGEKASAQLRTDAFIAYQLNIVIMINQQSAI